MRSGGEFITVDRFGNEHVIPNQFTVIGMQQVMKSAFQGNPSSWYMGVCAHNPADAIPLASITEPTFAHGYARQTIPMDIVNWPTIGQVNGESYVESRLCDFTVTAAQQYDVQTNRFFITDGAYVVAVSAPQEEGLHFINASFSTKYRLYIR